MPTSLTRSFLMLATVATSSCCSTIHSSLKRRATLWDFTKSSIFAGMVSGMVGLQYLCGETQGMKTMSEIKENIKTIRYRVARRNKLGVGK